MMRLAVVLYAKVHCKLVFLSYVFLFIFIFNGILYAAGLSRNTCLRQANSQQQETDDVGKLEGIDSSLVLPGFAPMSVQGNQINLGASRVYDWADSMFPLTFSVNGKVIAKNMQLVATINGVERPFLATDIQIKESSDAKVLLRTVGELRDSALRAEVETRVEYDGVAMVDVRLSSNTAVNIDKLSLQVEVEKNDFTTVMAFDADTIRRRQKRLLYPNNYRGRFINAIGFPNGQYAFWWFADNAIGWIWNGDAVTEYQDLGTKIELRQNIVGDRWRIEKPLEFRFNYLVTPVKVLNGSFRSDRIAGYLDKNEGKYARYHLWWITAFAHQDYPYLSIPKELQKKLPHNDLKVYPGEVKNRALMRKWRKMGIERLPYFSAHTLSGLDPALAVHRNSWEALPPYVIPPGSDAPFTAKIARPWLSHRATGYTNYLICRFDKLIDKMGFEGVYFDQGGVINSLNPAHGAWVDSRGNIQSSTDILGMREFFKRLAILFYSKGKRGDIIVHNSMSPVIPAYTFITAMLQGEEDVHYLKNLDYIATYDLKTIRSKYAGGEYGIESAWLSELWSPRTAGGRKKSTSVLEWVRTKRYRKAYRNLMALALLHDTPVFSKALLSDKKKIYKIFDRFDVKHASFHGYWENALSLGHHDVLVSYYRNRDKILAVISNLGDAKHKLSPLSLIRRILGNQDGRRCMIGTGMPDWQMCVDGRKYLLPGKDFLLLEVDMGVTDDSE